MCSIIGPVHVQLYTLFNGPYWPIQAANIHRFQITETLFNLPRPNRTLSEEATQLAAQ